MIKLCENIKLNFKPLNLKNYIQFDTACVTLQPDLCCSHDEAHTDGIAFHHLISESKQSEQQSPNSEKECRRGRHGETLQCQDGRHGGTPFQDGRHGETPVSTRTTAG